MLIGRIVSPHLHPEFSHLEPYGLRPLHQHVQPSSLNYFLKKLQIFREKCWCPANLREGIPQYMT